MTMEKITFSGDDILKVRADSECDSPIKTEFSIISFGEDSSLIWFIVDGFQYSIPKNRLIEIIKTFSPK